MPEFSAALAQRTFFLAAVVFVASCSSSGRPSSSPGDVKEQEAMKEFYGQLKEGQKFETVKKLLQGKRELICEGNQPGPQRCIVKFRTEAGQDFGAERLGLQFKNATVKDEMRVIQLDFRSEKLVRWESRSERIVR